jgi:hypothetical protein
MVILSFQLARISEEIPVIGIKLNQTCRMKKFSNLKVYYRVLRIRILTQLNSVHALSRYYSDISFNIILLPCVLRSLIRFCALHSGPFRTDFLIPSLRRVRK